MGHKTVCYGSRTDVSPHRCCCTGCLSGTALLTFNDGADVLIFLVSFLPTMFAFFGQRFNINMIYRYFSDQIPFSAPPSLFAIWGIIYPLRDYSFFCILRAKNPLTTPLTDHESEYIIAFFVQTILLLLWPRLFADDVQLYPSLGIILSIWGLGIYLACTYTITIALVAQLVLVLWLTYASYLNYAYTWFEEQIVDITECKNEIDMDQIMECINECQPADSKNC